MMSDEELEKWENERDLLNEIEDGVNEMLQGKECKTIEKFEKLGVDKDRLEKLKKIVVEKKKTFDDLK